MAGVRERVLPSSSPKARTPVPGIALCGEATGSTEAGGQPYGQQVDIEALELPFSLTHRSSSPSVVSKLMRSMWSPTSCWSPYRVLLRQRKEPTYMSILIHLSIKASSE